MSILLQHLLNSIYSYSTTKITNGHRGYNNNGGNDDSNGDNDGNSKGGTKNE